jgi:hypothetical protein
VSLVRACDIGIQRIGGRMNAEKVETGKDAKASSTSCS